MTEIEELIKQAEEAKAMWVEPRVEQPILCRRDWQEVLDNKPYPNLNVKNL